MFHQREKLRSGQIHQKPELYFNNKNAKSAVSVCSVFPKLKSRLYLLVFQVLPEDILSLPVFLYNSTISSMLASLSPSLPRYKIKISQVVSSNLTTVPVIFSDKLQPFVVNRQDKETIIQDVRLLIFMVKNCCKKLYKYCMQTNG